MISPRAAVGAGDATTKTAKFTEPMQSCPYISQLKQESGKMTVDSNLGGIAQENSLLRQFSMLSPNSDSVLQLIGGRTKCQLLHDSIVKRLVAALSAYLEELKPHEHSQIAKKHLRTVTFLLELLGRPAMLLSMLDFMC